MHIFSRIALGNSSNPASASQMDQVSIYLHEAGKFLFFLEDDTMPDNLLINKLKLKQV